MSVIKLISVLAYGDTALEKGLSFCGGMLILLLTFLVPLDVFLRYMIDSPIAGLYELSELMLVGMVYLSITYVQAHKGHVVIDIFYTKIPSLPRKALDILNYLLCFGVCLVMTWRTGFLTWQAWVMDDYTSGLVQWPLWPAKAVVTLGCGLLCLRLIRDLVNTFFAKNHSNT